MVMLCIYIHRLNFWWIKRVVLVPTFITFDVLIDRLITVLLERKSVRI